MATEDDFKNLYLGQPALPEGKPCTCGSVLVWSKEDNQGYPILECAATGNKIYTNPETRRRITAQDIMFWMRYPNYPEQDKCGVK